MSPVLWAVVIVAVIAVVVVIIKVAQRKKDDTTPAISAKDSDVDLLEKEVSSKSEEVTKASAQEEEEAPTQEEEEEPAQEEEEASAQEEETEKPAQKEEEAPALGVRLDESAEEDAAAKLKEAKRERKLRKLRQGLAPTRSGFISKIGNIFAEKKTIDSDLLDELEEAMITADMGAKTTQWFLSMLRAALDKNELADSDAVWNLLRGEVEHALSVEAKPWNFSESKPYTIMVVGVNGVGKTTTIGKLASQYTDQGHKVVLAAADTFRAAAVNQLEIWGRRTKSEVVKSKEGADPSSVVFDAIKHAKKIGADIVIADTAGRLHTQAPLMEELKKISRVMGKAHEGAPNEILLVLDATTGQNALHQANDFGKILDVTSFALTKLDGTAKGGVIIGICHEHKIPVRFIGIGEAKDDLREFNVEDFVEALFFKDSDTGKS